VSVHEHNKLPQGKDIFYLSLGTLGIGTSGPLIALSTMAIPVLVFWRNAIGTLILSPLAFRAKDWKKVDGKKGIKYAAIAGVCLSAHFLSFFFAVRNTTVAAGTALTAMQPIFAALIIAFTGGKIMKRSWIGMSISFLSLFLITGVDFQNSTRAFTGDLFAVLCAFLAAAYVWFGSKSQQTVSTPTYTSVCYFSCAITSIPFAIFSGANFFNYSAKNWYLLLALVLGAQILGHTMFNISLQRVSPAIVSLIVFLEVPIAALLAVWWLGQKPLPGTIPGIIILLIGCGIVVSGSWDKKSIEEVL
jgi:drug/metabolite transporter (DMT)-like permease